MATSSSVSQSFNFGRKVLQTSCGYNSVHHFFIKKLNAKSSDEEVSSQAVESLYVIHVPEYDVLLAADFRRCVRAVRMLQMMARKDAQLFDKF